MSSIVYMGRGSFRMEAVAVDNENDNELERREGVVQPLAGVVVTAPMHAGERGRHAQDSTTSTGTWQAPDLRPLFSSQIDVPLLAAPTGSAGFSTPPISISRVALVALGGVVLLCGVVIGTAVRHLLASPAAMATVSAPTPIAPPPMIEAPAPAAARVAVPAVEAPIAAPPVAVQATVPHPRIIKRAPVAPVRKAPAKAPAKTIDGSAAHWVDPFAE
ncbi:MAG TPA: hypothetical protein VH560_05205 [Polyangia bacterium]|nr:hypothetical protein [Polyangia bacterium]